MFQFPSNGKAYLNFRFPNSRLYFNPRVSIPFKRESISELGKKAIEARTELFQFPSNGKAYLNFAEECKRSIHILVSIPFKRESISERFYVWFSAWKTSKVSIPFKRESISELHILPTHWHIGLFWVSIPFKRESISELGSYSDTPYGRVEEGFQFPSNGKAYLNAQAHSYSRRSSYHRFNSLQTGKHIWTNSEQYSLCFAQEKFQFPSNGKAYLNRKAPLQCLGHHSGFNSLQTGKHIWTIDLLCWRFAEFLSFNSLQTGKHIWTFLIAVLIVAILLSFNSLQTGKHIWTKLIDQHVRNNRNKFQFPSNGKAYLN